VIGPVNLQKWMVLPSVGDKAWNQLNVGLKMSQGFGTSVRTGQLVMLQTQLISSGLK
jgi:hypothetical protein